MSDVYIFIWGVIAVLFAVGPLAVAGYFDIKEKRQAKSADRSGGAGPDNDR